MYIQVKSRKELDIWRNNCYNSKKNVQLYLNSDMLAYAGQRIRVSLIPRKSYDYIQGYRYKHNMQRSSVTGYWAWASEWVNDITTKIKMLN